MAGMKDELLNATADWIVKWILWDWIVKWIFPPYDLHIA